MVKFLFEVHGTQSGEFGKVLKRTDPPEALDGEIKVRKILENPPTTKDDPESFSDEYDSEDYGSEEYDSDEFEETEPESEPDDYQLFESKRLDSGLVLAEVGDRVLTFTFPVIPECSLHFLFNQELRKEYIIIPVALQIAEGLGFLHSRKIVLCSLNCCSVHCEGNRFKISDLSCAVYYGEAGVPDGHHEMVKKSLDVSSSVFIRENDLASSHGITLFSDVYSYGMILYEMLFLHAGRPVPSNEKFHENNAISIQSLKKNASSPDGVVLVDGLLELTLKCLRVGPKAPITLKDISEQLRILIGKCQKMNGIKLALEAAKEINETGWKKRNEEHFYDHLGQKIPDELMIQNLTPVQEKNFLLWYRANVQVFCKKFYHQRKLDREVDICLTLKKHKFTNVIQFLGFYEYCSIAYIVYEFAPLGDLSAWLLRYKGNDSLTPQVKMEFIKGIAKGLVELHRIGIAHRDLKSANVVLFEGPDGCLIPKIADFDLSSSDDFNQTHTQTYVGTYAYMPPEVYDRFIHPSCSKGRYNAMKADLYSFGCLVLDILYEAPEIFHSFDRKPTWQRERHSSLSTSSLPLTSVSPPLSFDPSWPILQDFPDFESKLDDDLLHFLKECLHAEASPRDVTSVAKFLGLSKLFKS